MADTTSVPPSGASVIAGISVGAGEPFKAYKQGDLDGLCGLYSAINAVAVLAERERPLTRKQSKRLLQQGLDVMAANMPLALAIDDGVPPRLWMKVIRRMVQIAADEFAMPCEVELLFGPRARIGPAKLQRVVEHALDARAVVLVSLDGMFEHYTLITSHTALSYILEDSGHLRRLAKAACGTARAPRRHVIDWRSAVAVRRGDGK